MAKLNFSIALGLAAQGFKSGLASAESSLKGFASSVKSAMGLIGGAFAAGQLKAFGKECMDAYSAQLQAEQKLSVIMKQRMGVADAEVKSVMKLASAQQELGVIGDEVQLAGAQQVATFLNEKQSLETLMPAMNNLLAQQKGLNATQGDAVNIGNLMGKVMQGQTSALKRVGITFTEAEEKVLKYGTESQRAAMLAEVIKNNVGDMNAELAKTDAGRMQQLSNTLGDLKEQIGAAIMPIMGQLAPKISEFATAGSGYIVGFINTVSENFKTFAEFVVSVFAAIKLTPIIQAWLTEHQSAQAQATAQAQAAASRREAIEQALTTKKNQLAVLEVKQTEVTGSQKLAIEQKIAKQRAAIKELETKLVEAQNAEQTANTAAQAAAQTTIWATAWNGVKAAGVLCWTTIKAAMVSTGIGAIIMGIIFAVQKLWDYFKMGEKVSKCWDYVCDGCKKAWDWGKKLVDKFGEWYDSLGMIGKGVLAMIAPFTAVYAIVKKIVDAIGKGNKESGKSGGRRTVSKKRYYRAKDGTVYETNEEAVAHDRAQKKAAGGGGGGTSKNIGGKTTTTTQTAAQKAAEDVVKAEKEYATAIKKAQEDTLDQSDAQRRGLSALQSLYDAYLGAYVVTGNQGYKAKMDDLIPKIEALSASVEAADETTKDAKEKTEAASKFRTDFAESLKKNRKTASSQRDDTYDYKLTSGEKTKAQLEFDLEKAKMQLDELNQYAKSECAEAIQAIADAEANVTSLKDQLALEQVKQDVEALQKELAKGWEDFGANAWQAVKGTVDNISGLVETMKDPDASGWEKFCSVIDTLMGLFQTFQSVMESINTIMQIGTRLKDADAAASQKNASTKEEEAMASASAAMAAGAETTGKAAASGASLPPPANIAAIAAGVAAGMSVVAAIVSILGSFRDGGFVNAYATGGFINGAYTSGDRNLIGVARVNAGEAILNPSQQRQFMRIANGQGIVTGGGVGGGKVKFEIEGRKLVGVLTNEGTKMGKIM